MKEADLNDPDLPWYNKEDDANSANTGFSNVRLMMIMTMCLMICGQNM